MPRFVRSQLFKGTNRRLFLESLENRQLMAADLDFVSPAISNYFDSPVAGLFASASSKEHHAEEEAHLEILRGFPTEAPETEAAVVGAISSGLSAAFSPLTSIPSLSSLAGAAVSLYLDFNGHFESIWGSNRNITTPV